MTFSLTAFIVSGSGIVFLVVLKMFQELTGYLILWPDVREKGEIFLKRHVKRTKRIVEQVNKRSFYIILHYVLIHVRNLSVKIQRVVDKKLVHLVNLIKGKKNIELKNSASPFLKDINNFKDTFRRD
jgi:hypothetical protein